MKFHAPYNLSEVGKTIRPEWHDGFWSYALGRPAVDHPGYGAAVDLATAGPRPFNPWWIRSWNDVVAVNAGCYMDEWEGLQVCNFFEKGLVHTKAGISEHAEAGRKIQLMDWHKYDLAMPIFGWRRTNGTRRVRWACIWVPKKNAKSFFCSGVGLYMLTRDLLRSALVYAAACTRKQAGIIHDEAVEMAKISPSELLRGLRHVDYLKEIHFDECNSQFIALASDAGPVEGENWSCLLFDEVHVQRARKFFDALYYGGKARRQPLGIQASTAGVYDPLSIGWEEYESAMKVYTGAVGNWEKYVYIAKAHSKEEKEEMPWVIVPGTAADADDEMDSPIVHAKANPAIDITIRSEDFLVEALEAVQSPLKTNSFKRYNLNMWTHAATRLISPVIWSACAAPYNYERDLIGRRCRAGADMSLSEDITSLGLWFPPEDGEKIHRVLSFSFLPKDNIIELEKENKAPYRQWAKEGWLELTDGTTIDTDRVFEKFEELKLIYDIQDIGYDPAYCRDLAAKLIKKYGDLFAIETRQTFPIMAVAWKWVWEHILRTTFQHNNNPLLTWAASNAQARVSSMGDVILMKRDHNRRLKIDPLVAVTIAGNRQLMNPEDKRRREVFFA